MNSFQDSIKKLESDYNDTYDIKKGATPVILTSAHGIGQKKRRGLFKLAEPYTRGIAKYVGKKTNCYYLIKNEDTGVDPNKSNDDDFKAILCSLIKTNHIKLAIDLHGAKKERDFDVEIGTLDGQSIDPKTVDKLIEFFHNNGLHKIAINDPFKGGDITKTVHTNTGINCLQLEINHNFRNLRRSKNLRNICKALSAFINNYR